jgi:hypothetical protein
MRPGTVDRPPDLRYPVEEMVVVVAHDTDRGAWTLWMGTKRHCGVRAFAGH